MMGLPNIYHETMTIQATFTTLTLTLSLISGAWTLAGAESTAGNPTGTVPVPLEEAAPITW